MLAAVIGRPVRHSLSPALHQAAFRAEGVDWQFARFELDDEGVPAAVAAMGPLAIGGYAVTMPHKATVARAVDEVDPAARALDSVNTVVLRTDGSTYGASTDGAGFVDWVHASGHRVASQRVAILGAGAAARSIVDALGRSDAADIAIINRTSATAAQAAAFCERARVGTFADVEAADMVVNATSVGMAGVGAQRDDVPVDVALLNRRQIVADIVYHPLDTALLRAARSIGAATIDGLGMLVHQAVRQQELWVGRRPDPAIMRAAAEAELARRA